jgi:uncharacterized protein
MGKPERLNRDSTFSYICNRCMSCCHNTHIPLDPYEITRLARNRSLSTTELIDRFLIEGGVVISSKEDHACAFLGDGLCNVYQDRPLICRTYPLRRVAGYGHEEFMKLIPFPETKGEYGENGTTRNFLEAYDIEPFVVADDKYFVLTHRIIEVLGRIVRSVPKVFHIVRETMFLHYELRAQNVPELIDVDRVVGDHCLDRGVELPADLDGLIALHIEAIEQRLAALIDAGSNETQRLFSMVDRIAHTKRHEILQVAALAGALGVATGAQVKPLLAAEVLGKLPATAMNIADQKVRRE